VHLGEAPVTESSDDGGYELSETKGTHEGVGRALGPGRTVRSSDEDEGLRDDGDLEVDNHVTLVVVDVLADWIDTELALEEGCRVHDSEESEGGSGEVKTVADTVCENFGKIPRVRRGGRKHSVQGKCHDSTVVQDR